MASGAAASRSRSARFHADDLQPLASRIRVRLLLERASPPELADVLRHVCAGVRERIAGAAERSGRRPEAILLVAVSKTVVAESACRRRSRPASPLSVRIAFRKPS